jgi:hypothetical protein
VVAKSTDQIQAEQGAGPTDDGDGLPLPQPEAVAFALKSQQKNPATAIHCGDAWNMQWERDAAKVGAGDAAAIIRPLLIDKHLDPCRNTTEKCVIAFGLSTALRNFGDKVRRFCRTSVGNGLDVSLLFGLFCAVAR